MPAWALPFSLVLVAVIFVLAEGISILTTGPGGTGAIIPYQSVIPEVLSAILNRFHVGFTVIATNWGQTGLALEQFSWEMGEVGPAEEFFKVGVINLEIAILITFSSKWLKQAQYEAQGYESKFPQVVIGLIVSTDAIWTIMHAILAYNSIAEFAIAFLAGLVLLAATWYFENLIPAMIAHGLWNFLGIFNLLTWFSVGILFVFGIALTGLIYFEQRK